MKIGFNMLVVGFELDLADRALFERMKVLGYEGAEVPDFDLDEARCRRLGVMLAEIGLEALAAGSSRLTSTPWARTPRCGGVGSTG